MTSDLHPCGPLFTVPTLPRGTSPVAGAAAWPGADADFEVALRARDWGSRWPTPPPACGPPSPAAAGLQAAPRPLLPPLVLPAPLPWVPSQQAPPVPHGAGLPAPSPSPPSLPLVAGAAPSGALSPQAAGAPAPRPTGAAWDDGDGWPAAALSLIDGPEFAALEPLAPWEAALLWEGTAWDLTPGGWLLEASAPSPAPAGAAGGPPLVAGVGRAPLPAVSAPALGLQHAAASLGAAAPAALGRGSMAASCGNAASPPAALTSLAPTSSAATAASLVGLPAPDGATSPWAHGVPPVAALSPRPPPRAAPSAAPAFPRRPASPLAAGPLPCGPAPSQSPAPASGAPSAPRRHGGLESSGLPGPPATRPPATSPLRRVPGLRPRTRAAVAARPPSPPASPHSRPKSPPSPPGRARAVGGSRVGRPCLPLLGPEGDREALRRQQRRHSNRESARRVRERHREQASRDLRVRQRAAHEAQRRAEMVGHLQAARQDYWAMVDDNVRLRTALAGAAAGGGHLGAVGLPLAVGAVPRWLTCPLERSPSPSTSAT